MTQARLRVHSALKLAQTYFKLGWTSFLVKELRVQANSTQLIDPNLSRVCCLAIFSMKEIQQV